MLNKINLEESAAYYKERFRQESIILMEHNTDMPTSSDSFISPCLMLFFHEQGTLYAQYDMQPKVFNEHKVVVILPNHMISQCSATPDFCRTVIIVSPRLLEEFKHKQAYKDHISFHAEPECELTEEQWNDILPTIDLLKTILNSTSSHKDEMILNLLDIMLQILNEYNRQNNNIKLKDDSHNNLFTQFYELLIVHYREEKDVKYYAEALYLTPKYFAKQIQNITGIRAIDWINNYVIMQAKSLLLGFPELTIQQISDRLGFVEQSAFCRFFKAHTKQTPSQFRN